MKISKEKFRKMIRESLSGLLTEGPGAGYYVSMEGLKAVNVHITGYEKAKNGGKQIDFKAYIAPSIVEWKAEGYYDAVTSEGIYYDGDMVQEFDDEDRTVNGGKITGYVLEDEVMDYYNSQERLTLKEVVEFINWKLDGFKFKTLVGSGYVHTNLSDPMMFEDLEIVSDNDSFGSEAIYIQILELKAPNISNAINWFFENCYKFDEIYGNNEEEGEMVNESIYEGITPQDLEECYTNDELCELFEKVLGVDSVETQGDWDQYLHILADKLNEQGLSYSDIDAMIQDSASEPIYESKNGKTVAKLNERQLRKLVRESLNELDWKTYASAGKKAQQWREAHPFQYDRNRGARFDQAAVDALQKKFDIHNQDEINYGGERGTINTHVWAGDPSISGSRKHDFGDAPGPLGIDHDVYHMSKAYGKDGNYGRTRMWDVAHETTPEEFYDNNETAKKFRDAEKEIEDYKNGNYEYNQDKGWHLKESKIRRLVRNSLKRLMFEEKQAPRDLTFDGLDLAQVKIIGGEGANYQFVAKINPQGDCIWYSDEEEGETNINSGTIEGIVDLSKIKGALDKRQGIQRQLVEKYIKNLFGYFSITGLVASLDQQNVTFTEESDMQIEAENNIDALISISKAEIQTSGFYNSDDEYYDDTEFEEPIDKPQEEIPAEPETEPVVSEPEVATEPETNPEQEVAGDFESVLRQAGFDLKEKEGLNSTYLCVISNDNNNQWVANYYPESKRLALFSDYENSPYRQVIEKACSQANVRFMIA